STMNLYTDDADHKLDYNTAYITASVSPINSTRSYSNEIDELKAQIEELKKMVVGVGDPLKPKSEESIGEVSFEDFMSIIGGKQQ
ncbi:MAG: hypothetical protein IIY06_03915, partial [Proteobacteria bacterium]|nr:hypothetical protein [Pseudomonadota bacterium]